MDEGVCYGNVELLDTPCGKILQSLVESGVTLGISSRGVGSTKHEGDYDVVQDDFQLICWDFVSEPSTPGAFMMAEGKDISHIIAMLHSTINNDYKTLVIHIFDGPSPTIKRATVDGRIKKTENAEKELASLLEKEKSSKLTKDELDRKAQLRSRSYKLTREKIDECCQLLSIMGLPHMVAYEEADPQCAMLQRYRDSSGKDLGIYGVIGEDTDLLAYGCELVVRDFGSQNVSIIDTNIMLEELGLNYNEFVDIFIFSGVDYFQDKKHTKGISGMGIEKVYKILKKIKDNKVRDFYTLQDAVKIPLFTKLK